VEPSLTELSSGPRDSKVAFTSWALETTQKVEAQYFLYEKFRFHTTETFVYEYEVPYIVGACSVRMRVCCCDYPAWNNNANASELADVLSAQQWQQLQQLEMQRAQSLQRQMQLQQLQQQLREQQQQQQQQMYQPNNTQPSASGP